MAIRINDTCTNCGACEIECPNSAVYEGGVEWSFSEGTKLSGITKGLHERILNADQKHRPLSNDFYYQYSV